MPEYQFAEKEGNIVNVEYDRSSSLSTEQVFNYLRQAFDLFPYKVDILHEDGYEDVYHVVYKDGDFKDIYICAKGTTPGGRSGLKDEQRIQPKAKYLNYVCNQGKDGKKAVFLGIYNRDGQTILCTWKVTSSAAGSLETPISKQIKIVSIAKAIKEGFVQQDKGKGEYACAFKPEFLYFYLKNSDWLHEGPVTELVDHMEFEKIDNIYSDNQVEQEEKHKNCLEIVREPRTNKVHPLNFIVYGAPGTGKTYSMVEYALSIIDGVSIDDFRKSNTDRKANVSQYKELVKAGQIVFTTFHQNYGYEEFIQGLRPDKDSETMAFKTVDGVFKVIADTALNDTENKNYVIIIDEINRANISKVFGELITLIEEDKRWGELNETSATLQSGDKFAVPNNLYIVGTMNSADKSISLIDAALRRRFDFIEQKPDSALVPEGVLRKMFDNINENLVSELDSTDLLVGHSYFMKKTEKDLCNILNNNIIPLLYEYFYDNRKKVAKLLKDAIDKSGAQIEIVDEKVGRLRVKDKVE